MTKKKSFLGDLSLYVTVKNAYYNSKPSKLSFKIAFTSKMLHF